MDRRKFLASTSLGVISLELTPSLLKANDANSGDLKELRLVLTVDNLDEVIDFYKNHVGLKESLAWDSETGKGIILEAGKASLELVDRRHKDFIDKMEVGKTGVSGDVRIALNFGTHMYEKSQYLLQHGANPLGKLTKAPWSNIMRIADPAGMQITLFEKSTVTDKK